jgi:MFS family permease
MGFFDRQQTVAGPGYNRWLFPPAALAVHLSIGQVYAFSVFKLPLTKIIGVTKSAPGDWSQPSLAWIFSLAIFFLGLSAAIFGRWVERVGPRKTMFTAASVSAVALPSPLLAFGGTNFGSSTLVMG